MFLVILKVIEMISYLCDTMDGKMNDIVTFYSLTNGSASTLEDREIIT